MWNKAWQMVVLVLASLGLCSCSPEARAKRHLERGWASVETGDLDHAIADLNCAIELKPDNAQAYWRRAEIYAGRRDWDSAVADYTRVLEVAPGQAFALNHVAWLLAHPGHQRHPRPSVTHFPS